MHPSLQPAPTARNIAVGGPQHGICATGDNNVIYQIMVASEVDPGNAQWQRDLSTSHNQLWQVRLAQGDFSGAEQAFAAAKGITEHLAAQDPGNAEWQRDLSIIHERLAQVRLAQGDLAGAEQTVAARHAIAERLAAQDTDNAEWQRDLSVSLKKMSQIAMEQGRVADVLVQLMASAALDERLVKQNPANVTVVVDYIGSLALLGYQLGKTDANGRTKAREMLGQALALAEALEREGRFNDVAQHQLPGMIREMISALQNPGLWKLEARSGGRGSLPAWNGQAGLVVFEDDGEADPATAGELSAELSRCGMPLVVLNACESALSPDADDGPALAAEIVKAGGFSAVGFSQALTVDGAVRFFTAFYESLAKSLDAGRLDEAMRAGRYALHDEALRHGVPLIDWHLPVWYATRDHDLPD